MSPTFCLCAFILGADYLFTVSARSVEDEILKKGGKNPIVGGEKIKIDRTPYLVQVLENDEAVCGGSILSPYWIVTAAHCIDKGETYSILSGSSIRSKGSNRHEVEEIIVHESYDKDSFDSDIALIKLKNKIKFDSKQKSIRILRKLPAVDDDVEVAGFGRIGTDEPVSKMLLATVLSVVPKDECQEAYDNEGDGSDELTENMFCAGRPEHDTCQGDSGGPAVIDGELAGIVSFGYECASDKLPGVYTQILNYVDWIKKVTGLKL